MESINIQKIEDTVSILLGKNAGKFSVAEVVKELSVNDSEGKIADRIKGSLELDERFYYDEDNNFICKGEFFNGKSFVVTPTEREIDENILIPGHRFLPFVNNEIFPSEIELISKIDGKKIETVILRDSVPELIPYHILMGAEQISDFFVAESSENKNLRDMSGTREKIVLNVFNMKQFYKAVNFKSGDALLCKIKDYDNGVIEVQYLPAKERQEQNIEKFVADYTSAISKVIERFSNYLELHEQLGWGFYEGRDDSLFGAEGASLDEFLAMADDLEIAFDDGYAVFVRKTSGHIHDENCDCGHHHDEDEDFDSDFLPEGIGISKGAVNSIEDILIEIGSTLSLAEIDAYMLDCCSVNNREFHEVFARMFNKESLNYADEAQEMIFLNYLEDRFENLSSTYDPVADKDKMSLRSLILEITDSRNEFFEYLKSTDIDENPTVEKELKKIAEASLHLSNILQLLNNPGYDLSEDEAEKMEASIEDMEIIIQDAIEAIKL